MFQVAARLVNGASTRTREGVRAPQNHCDSEEILNLYAEGFCKTDNFFVRYAANLRFDFRNRILANIPSCPIAAGSKHGLGHPARTALSGIQLPFFGKRFLAAARRSRAYFKSS